MGKKSNRDGVGALVTLTVAGKDQIRQAQGASGAIGKSWEVIHFGMGAAASADKLTVKWPSGKTQVMSGPIPGKKLMRVEEP